MREYICRCVNNSKSTCKLSPSVPGFASANLGIKNPDAMIETASGRILGKTEKTSETFSEKLYQLHASSGRNKAFANVDPAIYFRGVFGICKRPVREHAAHFPHHFTDARLTGQFDIAQL